MMVGRGRWAPMLGVLLWGVLACGGAMAGGPAGHGLTLEEAFALGAQFHPDLLAEQTQAQVAAAEIAVARQRLNPSLTLYGGVGRMTTVLGNPHMVSLSQPLELGGKRRARTLVAQASQTVTRQALNARRWAVRQAVRGAYIDLLAAQEHLALVRQQQALLQELVRVAQRRFEEGAAPKVELLQAHINLKQLQPQAIAQEEAVVSARRVLNYLTGNPLGEADLLSTQLHDLPNPTLKPVDAYVQQAVGQHPDVVLQGSQVALAQAQVAQARTLKAPDVAVSGGWLFVRTLSPLAASLDDRQFYHGAFLQVSSTVPVFHRFQAHEARATAQVTYTQKKLEAARAQLRTEVMKAYSLVAARRSALTLLDVEAIPEARKVLELSTLSYKYGKSSLSDVIVVQQLLLRLQEDYLNALVAYHQGLAALESATGVPVLP